MRSGPSARTAEHAVILYVYLLTTELQSGLKEGSSAEDRSAAQVGSEMETLHRHLAEVNLEQLLGAQVLSELGDPQGALRR